MSGFDNNVGTTQLSFAIGGPLGPTLQNDQQAPSPVGVMAVYNNLGVYGNIRAADPIVDGDVVTLGFLRSLVKPRSNESGLYEGGSRGGGLYG
jgi:hypothetical protein